MTARLEAAVAELVEALRAELAPAPDAPDRLLSIDETAAMLGIGRTALYGELTAGRLPSIHVGRRVLVARSSIDAFIAERAAGRS